MSRDLIETTRQVLINEVTDKEINAVKKLSKDIEKIKKDYFKIVSVGDKTLKDTKFNSKYESILKAQQEILSLIGELTNQKMMQDGPMEKVEKTIEKILTTDARFKVFKEKIKKLGYVKKDAKQVNSIMEIIADFGMMSDAGNKKVVQYHRQNLNLI